MTPDPCRLHNLLTSVTPKVKESTRISRSPRFPCPRTAQESQAIKGQSRFSPPYVVQQQPRGAKRRARVAVLREGTKVSREIHRRTQPTVCTREPRLPIKPDARIFFGTPPSAPSPSVGGWVSLFCATYMPSLSSCSLSVVIASHSSLSRADPPSPSPAPPLRTTGHNNPFEFLSEAGSCHAESSTDQNHPERIDQLKSN